MTVLPAPTLRPAPQVAPRREVAVDLRALFRAAAFAALTVVALVPVQLAAFLVWPLPTTVDAWFALFASRPIVALLDMDLILIVDYALLIVLFVGLAGSLWRVSPSLSALFVAFELVAAAAYFSSAVAFEMLAAGDLHSAATTEADRTVALAIGQGLLLRWQGTTFGISYVLSGCAMLLVGVTMLKGGPFGRRTAVLGVIAGVLSIVPASAGAVGLVLSLASLIPLWTWLILTALTLFAQGRSSTPDQV